MPYIAPAKQPFEEVARLIRGYMQAPKMAEAIGCTEPTARKKLDDPGRITLADLRALQRKGHIPAEEIREAIKF